MEHKLIIQHIHNILYNIVPKVLIDCIIKYVSFRVVDLEKIKEKNILDDYSNSYYLGHIKNNLYFTYYSEDHKSKRVIMLDVTKNKILHAPDNLQSINKKNRCLNLYMYKNLIYILHKTNLNYKLKILDYNFDEKENIKLKIDGTIQNLIFYKNKIYAITSYGVYALNLKGKLIKRLWYLYFCNYFDVATCNNNLYLLVSTGRIREYNCDTYEYKIINHKSIDAVFPFTLNNKYLNTKNKIIICDTNFKEINTIHLSFNVKIEHQCIHINNYFILVSNKQIIKYIKLYELY